MDPLGYACNRRPPSACRLPPGQAAPCCRANVWRGFRAVSAVLQKDSATDVPQERKDKSSNTSQPKDQPRSAVNHIVPFQNSRPASHPTALQVPSELATVQAERSATGSAVLQLRELQPATVDSQGPGSLIGPSAGLSTSWFFAYGSLLHRETLLSQDVRKVHSRDPAVVCDRDVRLVFRHRGGCATLLKALPDGPKSLFSPPDHHVHGVLYRLDNEELTKLKRRPEGGYQLVEIDVKTYSGMAVRAWVCVSSHMALLPHEVMPTESYMRQLREGAADQFLNPAYQAWLSSIETVPSAGLPMEYWNTPAKYAGYALLMLVAAIAAGFLLPH